MLIDADNHLGLVALLFSIVGASCWAERFSWAGRITAPVLIILTALILSNLGLIPREAPSYSFVSEYFVMASIPLLLFKADLRRIVAETGRLLFAFLVAAFGTVLGVVTAYLLVPVGNLAAKAAAVITGGYTGGGMNFVAVSKVVELDDPTQFAVVLGAEASVGLSYLMLLSLMPALAWFARWDAATAPSNSRIDRPQQQTTDDGPDLTHMGLAVGLSLAICAIGVGLATLAGQSRFAILAITVLAIAIANLARRQMQALKGDFTIGMLLLYVFFGVFGAGVDLVSMLRQAPALMLFALVIVLVHAVVAFGLGRLFGFSAREVAIASNACVLGPPTAAAVAARSGWHELVTPGILCGIFGYLIGNFLGAAVFELLK